MHHPTDNIVHTITSVIPVVEHWLEQVWNTDCWLMVIKTLIYIYIYIFPEILIDVVSSIWCFKSILPWHNFLHEFLQNRAWHQGRVTQVGSWWSQLQDGFGSEITITINVTMCKITHNPKCHDGRRPKNILLNREKSHYICNKTKKWYVDDFDDDDDDCDYDYDS